ncbi:sensor histidine kinase [Paenibacillus ginsengarvi]|uniref:histidine kinase n=1 Tax=Paenibacillus ginsengarvi TaxID=400777 RepID=A0A3B0C978_9BACL|nr:HAMP domain-containing sensor histidine kinase [Paenibacillus ginsengarvi]RKN82010.1 sensor histidine kinase [Paenibacillus ginsengarvi]
MGIRKRLVGSYLIVIIITVCILEAVLIGLVRAYYYGNIERILMNQAEISASFYEQYFAVEDVAEQAERLLRGFAQNSSAQVQIIAASGLLLRDTLGERAGKTMTDYPDVRSAIGGDAAAWKGRELSTKEAVSAASYPLKAGGATVGAVRFVSSLTDSAATIRHITIILIVIGLAVIAIVAVLGMLLSGMITGSITELKQAAEKMAEGDFKARAAKRYRDELGALADTFNRMAMKIERHELLKNEFFSSVSHEIRTPLTSIKGWAVTLKYGHNDDKALLKEGLDIIEAETDRLTKLVDELLDFSKLDSGRMELARAPVELSELLRYVGRQLAPRAIRQNIELSVQAEEMQPVYADESRLKQVLVNLLDNSFKFTGSGGSIRLCARPDGTEAVITVEDTGEGIEERDLEQVRQRFYKGNGKKAGSGLGLAISEEIVKLHNGRLVIESEPGQGTKVGIYLPMQPDPDTILTIS